MDDKNDKEEFLNVLPALAGKAYVEELRHLDTVAVVDLKSLTGAKNTELFEIL